MSSWNFDQLIPGCIPVTPPGNYGEMYLLPTPSAPGTGASNWLVGAYKNQTRLATDLRTSPELQQFAARKQLRFGLRDTDRPPAFVARQERYGALLAGNKQALSFDNLRLNALAVPARSGPAASNRRTDREENVAGFWRTQTPQSHHIVEFNHLEKIGASHAVGSDDLDHAQLPCVLLAAEFHQRYISLILKATHGWGDNRLKAGIADVYRDLYTRRSLLFEPLWEVSKVILKVARDSLAADARRAAP